MTVPDKATVETIQLKGTVNEEVKAPRDSAQEAAARGQGVSGYEKLSVLHTIKKFKVNSLVCFLVTLSAATDGYQIGLIGNIIADPGFVEQFGTQRNSNGDIALASKVLVAWNTIGSCGQILGMVTLPFLTAALGRKISMYYYWAIPALSVAIECFARSWQVWLIAKLFGGIGVGCLQSTIPGYISEVAPPRSRGAFLMCYSLWWITGQFFAPVSLQTLSKKAPNDFLTPMYTQWAQIGLMMIIYLLIPESPASCAVRGKVEEAKSIEHERVVAAEQRNEKWWAIFQGRDGKRTLISCWTLMSQQFIGLGVFFTYGSYFVQKAGIHDPFGITCITSGINIAASIVVIYLADVTGRACVGTTVCMVCNVAVGILGVVPPNNASNNLLVFFSCIWNIGLVANGATGWGFIGEISSQRLRVYTAGFAAASTCAAGVVMGVLIPYMLNENGWDWGLKTCWFFAGIGLPFTVAMWTLIPETSGRSAAELDELFERGIKPYRFHKTTTATQRIMEARRSGLNGYDD